MKHINLDEWSIDEPEVSAPESWGQWGMRQAVRGGANISSLAGIPGTLIKGGQQLSSKAGNVPDISTGLPLSVLSEAENLSPDLLEQMISSQKQQEETGLPIKEVDLPGLPIPSSENIKGFITSKLPPNYLETQGVGEEFLDRFTTDVPYLAYMIGTGGLGAVPGVLGKAIAVNSAGQVAKSIGLGPVGDIVAGITAATLYDLKSGLGKQIVGKGLEAKRTPKMELHLDEIRKNLYQDVKEGGKSLPISGTKLEKDIQKELSQLESGASGLRMALSEDVINELEKVHLMISGGKLNLTNAINQKQHLNELIRNEKNSVVRNYYTRAVGSINGAIQDALKDNPELIGDFNRAENITKALNKFREADNFFVQIYNDLNKTVKEPSLKNLFGLTLGKKAGIFSNLLTNVDDRTIRLMTRVPEAREYFNNILKASLTQNKQNLLKNVRSLDKAISKNTSQSKAPQYLDLDEWVID